MVGLGEMILAGDLTTGTRSPATHIIARDKGGSHTTVVTFCEQLAADGLIASRVCA